MIHVFVYSLCPVRKGACAEISIFFLVYNVGLLLKLRLMFCARFL